MRQGIEPTSSWIQVGFVSAAPQWELPNVICFKWLNAFLPFLPWPPFFKAATKVVESKRARTTSQDKTNSNDTELETEANLDIGQRFVSSLIYFMSHECNIYVKWC